MAGAEMRVLTGLALAVAAAGCASTSAEPGFNDLKTAVEARTRHRIYWEQGTVEDAAVARLVHEMLGRPLGLEAAVQIALLENRSLRATYEELAIAQADVVQAGLLQNPVFGGSVRFGGAAAASPNIELSVVQDFLGLLLLPARKRLARAQFEAAKLHVGDAVLRLASDVRVAYYTLQGALQVAAMQRLVAQAAEASVDLARRQHEAGNLSDLGLASEQGAYEQSRLDVARTDAEVIGARERLMRLMGVWGTDAGWTVPDRLAPLPPQDPPLTEVEARAIAQRFDVAAAREETRLRAHAVSLAKAGQVTQALDVGASAEQDTTGQWVVGPRAEVRLPIFDQGQAAVARFEAELRQSRQRLHARAVDARSEVREARGRLLSARSIAERYRDVVVPLRERIVALSQEQYGAMLLGIYQVLAAKQQELAAYREYVESVRDYWIARAELERAAGGRLVGPLPPQPRTEDDE